MSSFTYRVNYHHNGIVPTRFREFRNEVYTDSVPAFLRDWEWLEFSNRQAVLRLCAEAQVAVGDIQTYIS